MGAHVRLWSQISTLVLAGALLVALGVTLLLRNTFSLRDSASATQRADAYVLATVNLERLVVDAETGLRGYVITRRPLFLAPLQSATARFTTAASALQADAISDREFRAQASTLIAQARAYMAGYVPGLLRLASRNPRGARSFAVTLIGKREVDAVRRSAASLEQMLGARQTARLQSAHRTSDHAVSEGILVLILLTVLTTVLGAVLGRLVVSREVARERAERTARVLQESLLPGSIPAIEGAELAVRFDPAGADELIGGDFYDVFQVGRHSWAIILGDVRGKGAGAAAVTAMARWTLRSIAPDNDPARTLSLLNEAMLRQDPAGRFITVVFMLITVTGVGSARATVASAGHPPPIFLPASGEPVLLECSGPMLGVWHDIGLRPVEVQLGGGDYLVAYTDGLTDRGPYSGPPPEDVLREASRELDAEELASFLDSRTRRSGANRRDDTAILVVRIR